MKNSFENAWKGLVCFGIIFLESVPDFLASFSNQFRVKNIKPGQKGSVPWQLTDALVGLGSKLFYDFLWIASGDFLHWKPLHHFNAYLAIICTYELHGVIDLSEAGRVVCLRLFSSLRAFGILLTNLVSKMQFGREVILLLLYLHVLILKFYFTQTALFYNFINFLQIYRFIKKN